MGPQIRQCNVYSYIYIYTIHIIIIHILYNIYIYIHIYTACGLATTWGWSFIWVYHPPNFVLAAQLTTIKLQNNYLIEEWHKSSWRSLLFFVTSNPSPSNHLGVSLNGGTPNLQPKMIIVSRKTHGFVGETHHFRKPSSISVTFFWYCLVGG